MPCSPGTITPPILNPPDFGFGIAISPFQLPFSFSIPTDLIEDLLALLNSLGLVFPSGTFKPNIDEYTKSILDAISSLLSQVAPYLSFYKFITALLNLIMCIIEIICALVNPFALVPAIVKLFTECIQPFLLLFPWLALIAMIIALLLLILALIEYIIAFIIALIQEILQNILILAQGLALQDAEATLAAIQKIADVMCLIQSLMAVFVALGAILAIIQALALIGGAPVCADSNSCCVGCPPFIKDGPITGSLGQLTYHSQVGVDIATILGIPADQAALFNIPPIREERWQFINTDLTTIHKFAEILTPVPIDDTTDPPVLSSIFWPEGMEFDGYTDPTQYPYTVDITLSMDPANFGHAQDTRGRRKFQIKGCGVVRKPYFGLYNYAQVIDPISLVDIFQNQGTLNLEGGLVYENDGTSKYMKDGYQATLNNFLHSPNVNSSSPATSEDGITFTDIDFTFTPNYGVLMGYNLITAGCIPSIAVEKAVVNATLAALGTDPVVNKLQPREPGVIVPSTGFLPNVDGTQACVLNALEELKKSVSLETVAVFQATTTTCLTDLRNQTQSLVCEAIIAGVSQFNTEISLDTDIQFTSRNITATVIIKDASGTNIGTNIPASCVPQIEALLIGTVTQGEITGFTYDGSQQFSAMISSLEAGAGILEVSFNGKVISRVIPGSGTGLTSQTIASKIEELTLPYSFISAVVEPAVRRDAGDVSNS